MTPQASIIINTYNRPEPLSRCLEAVSRQDVVDQCEVIVVDDGSRGNFHAIERLWQRTLNLKFITTKHAGPAAARNRGVQAATGERILFLGDDVMVRPGWLAAHLARGQGHRMLAVLGPYRLEKRPQYSQAFHHAVDPVHFEWIKNPDDVGFEFFFTGNISMDRGLFDELKGFDETFPYAAWEDVDFGLRFKKAGGTIIFCEEARAVHEHPPMTRKQLWEREYRNGISHWIFCNKWGTDANPVKYWQEQPKPGPSWRRTAGGFLIELFEKFSPESPALPKLYERMVYSWRHVGLDEGARQSAESSARTIVA